MCIYQLCKQIKFTHGLCFVVARTTYVLKQSKWLIYEVAVFSGQQFERWSCQTLTNSINKYHGTYEPHKIDSGAVLGSFKAHASHISISHKQSHIRTVKKSSNVFVGSFNIRAQ
jgi:hypothetical protein